MVTIQNKILFVTAKFPVARSLTVNRVHWGIDGNTCRHLSVEGKY